MSRAFSLCSEPSSDMVSVWSKGGLPLTSVRPADRQHEGAKSIP